MAAGLRPWLIGFTLNQAFRRSTLEQLGGFDERLGAGAPDFPSSADMDINYRFLRCGGIAALAPAAAATHDQWRTLAELGPQYERYMRGWDRVLDEASAPRGRARRAVAMADRLPRLRSHVGQRLSSSLAAASARRASQSSRARRRDVEGMTYPW